MSYRVGIDVGGTFIDLVIQEEGRERRFYKSLTDPGSLSRAVLEGLAAAATDLGVELEGLLSQTEVLIHGSTVATNSLLTRSGARTALLTTEGFRDILAMRRGLREDQYNPRQIPPVPLIPRHRIHAIRERIDSQGVPLVAVAPGSLASAGEALRTDGVESVAVGLLFSFLNPAHEQQLGAALEKQFPGLHVSLSSQVLPEVRFYERLSTTVVNAYVTPVLARYLESLESVLREKGFTRELLVMQSNGGVMGSGVAGRFGVRSILSGPAAAPVAGLHHGAELGLDDVITMDMGGTSCDLCLIRDGEIQITRELEIAGHRIALPLVAVHTIGAGGGSILALDSRGLLQAGPASAGSTPGPACYGRGGTRATVTDADLLLGYLDAERFWGGRLRLDREAAEEALLREVARPLGMTPVEAARGAYRVVNANMVDAVREISVQRGYDPRRFLLLAAGGAGPLHAAAIASELRIPLVLVPAEASVLCAAGLLLSDLRHDFVRSCLTRLGDLPVEVAAGLYAEMEEQARETFRLEGIGPRSTVLSHSMDLRYAGQFTEVEVELERIVLAEAMQGLPAAFHRRHQELNGYSMPDAPLEVVNLRLLARGVTPRPVSGDRASPPPDPRPAAYRRAFFGDGFQTVEVHDSSSLGPGSRLGGPALLELENTTVVVPPGWSLESDSRGNHLLWSGERSLEQTLSGLARRVSNGV